MDGMGDVYHTKLFIVFVVFDSR